MSKRRPTDTMLQELDDLKQENEDLKDCLLTRDAEIDSAAQAIKTAIKEALPDKDKTPNWQLTEYGRGRKNGYNLYHSKVIALLDGKEG